MRKVSSVLLVGLFVCGCATVGKQIDMSKLAQFKEGVTTERDVTAALGNPDFKSLTSDGKTIATYTYTRATNKPANFVPVVGLLAGGMNMQQQTVQFLFNKDGVLEKYIANDSNQNINSGLLNTN